MGGIILPQSAGCSNASTCNARTSTSCSVPTTRTLTACRCEAMTVTSTHSPNRNHQTRRPDLSSLSGGAHPTSGAGRCCSEDMRPSPRDTSPVSSSSGACCAGLDRPVTRTHCKEWARATRESTRRSPHLLLLRARSPRPWQPCVLRNQKPGPRNPRVWVVPS